MFPLAWATAVLSFGVPLVFCEDPEIEMTVPEIIRYWGYPVEIHYAVTQDGYILELHRIPYGKAGPTSNISRPVIFLQHGLESSSSCWVMNLPEQSAGFVFADAGFDVWMGNMRGNKYSEKHITLSPYLSEFWNFTWDKMSQFDLPAMIDQALIVSGQAHLYYVGHSQGTLTMFAKLSTVPSFSKKIKMFFALAPVGAVGNIKGLLKTVIAQVSPDLATRIPVYVSHFPAGTSSMNILHWVQLVKAGIAVRFNYGEEMNIATYGQKTPPTYNFRDIPDVPIYVFAGGNDWIADEEDLDNYLLPYIRSQVQLDKRLPEYNHFDFIWGLRAAADVYKPITRLIQKNLQEQRV